MGSMTLSVRAGRHRWVVYKDLSWPLGQEATAIAPDWHGDDLLLFCVLLVMR